MPQTRVIRFRPEHLDRIMEIERASFGRHAYTRAMFRDLRAQCGSLFFVARHGRTVAGYAVACADGDDAEIISIAIDPAFRRAGVGTELMAALLESLAVAGARRVSLMVRTDNAAAMRFYRRFGFRRVQFTPKYYEDGADGWLMRKLL